MDACAALMCSCFRSSTVAWNLGSVSVHRESALTGVNPNKGDGDCDPSEPVPLAPNRPGVIASVVVSGVPAVLLRC